MKRKLFYFALLIALVFTAGCNKNKEQPEPTPAITATPTATPAPTATPTPTPVPNLAKENLNKLPEQFDKLMSYKPVTATDPSQGIGYDFTMKLSLGKQIASLLELTDLESVSIRGTADVKDIVAANLDICLNDTKLLNAHLFADAKQLLFNLPAYSGQYGSATWEELANALNEGTEFEVPDSSLFGSNSEIIRTINTVDKNSVLTNEELEKLLRDYIKEFTELFVEVPGITEHASVGTGDYLFTGEKHTVRADAREISALLERMAAELQSYFGDIELPVEESATAEEKYVFLDYYTDNAGNYAWAFYFDTTPDDVITFVNTRLGFSLYRQTPDGTEVVGMYSVKSSEKSGTVTLVFDREEPLGTIDYEYSDNSFYLYTTMDTTEFTMEYTKTNDTIRYNASIVAEGVSMVIKETVTPTRTDISASLASFGMEYLTMSMSATVRDYVEIPLPQNTIPMETWTEELNTDALAADLENVMQQYPILAELFKSAEENQKDTPVISGLPEGYTDDFMELTGYSVDEYGNVDFIPLEDEVLALGKPSTAFLSKEITEDTMKELFDYAYNSYTTADYSLDYFYDIYGNVYDDTVRSSYVLQCCYYDTEYPDNSIWFLFDAVNENLASIYVDNVSLEDAITIANDLLVILGVDYTLTASELQDYVFFDDMYAFCYEDDGYYSIYISY